LETRKISSLFFARQINGTTGYEEAATQNKSLLVLILKVIGASVRKIFHVKRKFGIGYRIF